MIFEPDWTKKKLWIECKSVKFVSFTIRSPSFFSPIITPRWRPLLMGDATRRLPCDDEDEPGIGNEDGIGTADGNGTEHVDDDGKCDGPESSTVQKASAVAPTKAVGVICWSLLLLSPLFLLVLLLLLLLSLLLPLFHLQFPLQHQHHMPLPLSPAWRIASAATAARLVVIHPRGTVVSAAHNRWTVYTCGRSWCHNDNSSAVAAAAVVPRTYHPRCSHSSPCNTLTHRDTNRCKFPGCRDTAPTGCSLRYSASREHREIFRLLPPGWKSRNLTMQQSTKRSTRVDEKTKRERPRNKTKC